MTEELETLCDLVNRLEGAGMDMQATARALIWASISEELNETERSKEFFQRFFGEACPW